MRSLLLGMALLLAGAGAAGAAPRLADYTNMSYDPGHGTQVEYLQPDGASFLWYPGNRVVLPGRWMIDGGTSKQPAHMCFLYGPNTYNPVTGQRGSQWECAPLEFYEATLVEQAKGDVFGLARRLTVPFVLPRGRTTIDALAGRPAPSKPAPSKPVAPKSAPASIEQECASVLAKAESSRANKIQAALLYFHGMRMGKKCVEIDYLRAFQMLREAKDSSDFNSLVSVLRKRAETGNPRAIAALKKLDLSPVGP